VLILDPEAEDQVIDELRKSCVQNAPTVSYSKVYNTENFI